MKLGPPLTLPLRAACVRGGTVTLDVHAFARARKVASLEVETAEDHAGRIGAAIEASLDCVNIPLDNGTARLSLSDIRLFQDKEPDAFHWFAQVTARVLAT